MNRPQSTGFRCHQLRSIRRRRRFGIAGYSKLGVLLALLALAVLGAWFFRREAKSSPSTPIPRPLPAFVPSPRVSPEVLARFHDLEVKSADADRTVWSPERVAEQFEEYWIQSWEKLRLSDDRMGDLAELSAGEWSIPRLTDGRPMELGIEHRSTFGQGETWNRREWTARVHAFRKEGWVLDGVEIRMPEFTPPTAGRGGQAVVAFEAHFIATDPVRRAIVRGSFRSEWDPIEAGSIPTGLKSVQVTALDAFTRTGPPAFKSVAREILRPRAGLSDIDPLVVVDLDGDGRDEILLVARNLVYRNLPGGFRTEPLLTGTLNHVKAAIVGDFNGDDLPDLLGADGGGVLLFAGIPGGRFSPDPRRLWQSAMANPAVITSGDVEGDGDLDLWIGQYKVPYQSGQMPFPYHDANDGFPATLLIQEPGGIYRDGTTGSGLEHKRLRRTYSASWVDLDQDGDLDLVNVSDFAGLDVYFNETRPGESPRFRDVTDRFADPKLFGMAHAVADLNADGWPDLLAIGMYSPVAARLDSLSLGYSLPGLAAGERSRMNYGNRVWLNAGRGTFLPASWNPAVARTGWTWGVCVNDFDNDGDEDWYLVNGHKSHASVRDYDVQFWTHDIAMATGTNLDPALSLYFDSRATRFYGGGYSYGGNQRNVFFLRDGNGGYTDVAWLLGLALPEDCRNVVAADLDTDGRLDLVVTGVNFLRRPAEHMLMIYRNELPMKPSARIGLVGRAGAEFAGPPVVVEYAGGSKRNFWPVTGASYRCQGPQSVHVGWGRDGRVVRATRGTMELPVQFFERR